MSRRRVVSAGASVLMPGSRPGARAQGTPESSPERLPHRNQTSGRDTSSWFVISRPTEPGYVTDADRFEVHDGGTFERLGGFQAVGTTNIAVTANPAKILLGTSTGPSIFDLETGNVAKVAWGGTENVEFVRLPDPRSATPTPARWSYFTDINYVRALLVDLDNATGVDLAETLVKPGETAGNPSLCFSPDGMLAAGSVTYNGYYLLDPESPAEARLLDGGKEGWISWGPAFSPDSSRLAYVIGPSSGDRGRPTLVVQDLGSDDVVEIGPISRDGFVVFPPDSDDDLIVIDSGIVARCEIDGGREVWEAEPGAAPRTAGISGNTLFLGSATNRGEGPLIWETIDLDTGDARRLPLLRGLTRYNGSYTYPEPTFQLMGPAAIGPGSMATSGPLAGVQLETGMIRSLLDEVDGASLPFSYATSQDSGTILYALEFDSRYFMFDLASGEQRAFTYDLPDTSPFDLAVSADGAAAGFTHWDISGSGRMDVWLLDVAGRGEPEPFQEGRLWVWAGGTPAPADEGVT